MRFIFFLNHRSLLPINSLNSYRRRVTVEKGRGAGFKMTAHRRRFLFTFPEIRQARQRVRQNGCRAFRGEIALRARPGKTTLEVQLMKGICPPAASVGFPSPHPRQRQRKDGGNNCSGPAGAGEKCRPAACCTDDVLFSPALS